VHIQRRLPERHGVACQVHARCMPKLCAKCSSVTWSKCIMEAMHSMHARGGAVAATTQPAPREVFAHLKDEGRLFDPSLRSG
jgi:hypothetical protein